MANMRLVKLKNRPSKGVFVFEYMQEQIERNYSRIKDEVEQIVQDEMARIKADPELRKRLLQDEKDEENND